MEITTIYCCIFKRIDDMLGPLPHVIPIKVKAEDVDFFVNNPRNRKDCTFKATEKEAYRWLDIAIHQPYNLSK